MSKNTVSKAIIDLGTDLYFNKIQNYSLEESNQVLRNAINKELGVSEWTGRTFRHNKDRIYQIVESTLDVIQPKMLEDVFGEYVETRYVGWGETPEFNIPPSRKLFQVATVSYGNGSVRRQDLEVGGKMQVPTALRHITVYASWYEFVTGRIDWMNVINTMNESFVQQIRTEIYDLVKNSFNTINTPYKETGTFDYDKLVNIASHLVAEYGGRVAVMGTKSALVKVTRESGYQLSDSKKDEVLRSGFLGSIDNMDFIELQQVHAIGTDDFLLDNNMIFIVPQGANKFIKLFVEGDTIIKETDLLENKDFSKEYMMMKSYGLALVPSVKYGIYQFA